MCVVFVVASGVMRWRITFGQFPLSTPQGSYKKGKQGTVGKLVKEDTVHRRLR